MIPISTAVSSGFTFSRISRGYEIKQDNLSIGTLQRPSFWSCRYEATTPEGSWTFRRGGFFNTGIEIVDPVSQQVIAFLKSSWSRNGKLTFSDGRTFLLASRGWWHPVSSITTEDERLVLELHTRERRVDVQRGVVADRELSMLALFLLYRMQLAEQDAAVAVMIAAS